MCGITGWIDWKEDLTAQQKIIKVMTDTMAPRGPDDQGIWASPQVLLGHRRLVVMDPAGGIQPMERSYLGKTATIVYNGELYNSNELRSELEGCGHRFQTRNSDTEVLLLSYLEWGAGCVERLNGIYAFSIWEHEKKTLFAARDRLGVKPFFYLHRGSTFLFASELKGILAHPAVKPEVDRGGLAEVLVMGPARTPGEGVFRGVKELKPGHCLFYSSRGLKVKRYWSLQSKTHDDDEAATAQRVRELLSNAVSRQLQSDKPLCTFLSGGLDSSAITALAAGLKKEPGLLHSFAVDYDQNNRFFQATSFQPDEDSRWSQQVAEYLGIQHHLVILDNKDLAAALPAALMASDLPGMADIDTSLLLFCREVKKEFTVAVSGECADEVFGGYPWFYDGQDPLAAKAFPWMRSLPERMALLNPEIVKLIIPGEYVQARYREALAEVPLLPGESPADERQRILLYLTMSRFMPTLLDRKDRMSMASGLEVRVPFSDHHLVEYVWNIPWALKNTGSMRKGILRRGLEGLLPDNVLYRPKSPYPKTHHPVYLNEVRNKVMQILETGDSPLSELINPIAITQMLARSPYFEKPWFGQLMGDAQYLAFLIQVERWLRDYKVNIRI